MKKIAMQFLTSATLLLTLLSSQNILAQSTVVIPGTFQSELGCSGDWQPDCDATRLIQTAAGIWEGTFMIPAGNWEYKVAYDNNWGENYGAGGVLNGPNFELSLDKSSAIHFTYSSVTHLVSFVETNSAVVLAGSFQDEVGCSSDWQPDCGFTSMLYNGLSNIWYKMLFLPPGNYEYKVAIDNSWDENYGQGGVPNGPNIPLTITGYVTLLFRYDPVTHIVTSSILDNAVTLAGNFQSELGCSDDWQPYCNNTGLTYDAAYHLWRGQLTLPAGSWEFKVAINGSWDVNYGEGGVPGGPNIQLNLTSDAKVSFAYNPDTHFVSYTIDYIPAPETVVIPGTFQSELGCTPNSFTGDWEPACDYTRLTYDPVNKVWTGTFDIAAGYWEYKVAINNSWSENYGLSGIQGGPNIPLYLETPANITFKYNQLTHLVTLVYNTSGLCANSFYDANVNGINDEGIPMEGVTFSLSGNSTAGQNAGSDGKVCYTNLGPGIYTIEATALNGYIPTSLNSQTVALTQPVMLHFGNVCLGSAGAKPASFWMNKQGQEALDHSWNKEYIIQSLQYLNLRNENGSLFMPKSFEELKGWLQKANAKNMSYKLSAELVALYLNLETAQVGSDRIVYTPGVGNIGAHQDFMYVYSLMWYTSWQLFQYPTARGGDSYRSGLEALKDLLEKINSDQNFVQLRPCSSNAITSIKANPDERSNTLSTSSKVFIWPNPAASSFNLRPANSVSNENVQIRVMDTNGKLVYSATGTANKDYHFGESLKPGLYFVEIIQGNRRSTNKILKQ
ncbi:T9SS type A sorting domain-containing protein [Chitinophagaceae bacterium LB-8]|uniref:T9SS type A sorting domain-containing protein n=1 Tax=Paraflavisolibacter caeni TaxID=2982496 RepID=A0A9X3BGS8_9BACT|nr:T9SS type A sorting domain-containing protein [Paraflavisolibacter caeni]MCU7551439.1 T9SS type A sorting domain-containing protein [Paraflavisolibacter caeni]